MAREKKGGHLLKFQKEGLKEVHLITEQINFPIAIALYDDWQKMQVQYLLSNIKSTRFSSYEICRWCIAHSSSSNRAYWNIYEDMSLRNKMVF